MRCDSSIGHSQEIPKYDLIIRSFFFFFKLGRTVHQNGRIPEDHTGFCTNNILQSLQEKVQRFYRASGMMILPC
jgi:hypothetical protein